MFWLSFLVAGAFWPGTVDPATNARWAIMAVLGAALLLHRGGASPLKGVGLAAIVMTAATLAWTPDILSGADDLVHALILATIFCLGATYDDLSPAWKGLAAGVGISAAIALAQAFGYEGVEQAVPPAGLFMNKNSLAEAGLVATVGAFGSWWALPAAAAMLLGKSKAVFATAALVAGIAMWASGRRQTGAALLAALTGAAVYLFASGHLSASIRQDIWRETIEGMTWLGNGLGSFEALHHYYHYAHSEPLQLAFELGLFAVLPAAIAAQLLIGEVNGERLVLIAVLAVGVFSFPLHLPTTAFAAALAAGCLAGRSDRLRVREPLGRMADQGLEGQGAPAR